MSIPLHVVVTGASAGIGAGIARAYARAGARLSLVARRGAPMQALLDETGATGRVFEADLATPERSTVWLADAIAAFGEPDVLVNNAGAQVVGHTAAGDPDDGERTLRLNVFTPLRLIRAVLPGMLERKSGTIVNIASMAALAPTLGMTYYNAGKAGIAAASEALRGEVRKSGVNVITVYPGPIPTDMGNAGFAAYEPTWMLKMQAVGTVDELARRVVRAVERREARVIYPGGTYTLARWMPPLTRWVVDRFTPPLR
ncbi:MAG: SDR family NAD(P)-dependent oxidoreductase [Deltaproteobacteria bacterium]|nr:SDR family NAD(P)-dependent oxidoreductase [Deltaproteobacteria bacterium]